MGLMATRKQGNSRKTTLEQFYTPADWATRITAAVVAHLGIDAPTSMFIEPAAGSGAFLSAIRNIGGTNVLAVDIAPAHPDVKQVDFLKTDMDLGGCVCITNPPFGRNHSLSVPFFNKLASQGCNVIAFIVPKSWRKWSITNRLDGAFFKVADVDTPIASYVDKDGVALSRSNALETILQVWVRGSAYGIPGERSRYPNPKPPTHFELASPGDANTSLTIFGRGCGTVSTSFDRSKKKTTQMYLNVSDENRQVLRDCSLSPFYSQVAYVEALSRIEIDFAMLQAARGVVLDGDYLRRSTLSSVPGAVSSFVLLP